jgi:phytoene dehydrogenase-like protein
MSDTYDFVVIGSGHNGLTTAAYLAKAGQKILVLERNDWFGGGVVTKEILAPGFKFDLHSSLHVNIQANPLILQDELQLLAKYGLKYLYPDAVYSTIFDDQTSPTRISIEPVSRSPRSLRATQTHIDASPR